MSDAAADAVVARWCAADAEHAILRNDREVIESTATARALIAEQLLGGAREADRDLLNAFVTLGRLTAERGGSPTLAAAIADGAVAAMPPSNAAPAWLAPARAALAEAFARAAIEAVRAEANARWEYPGCAACLADGTVTVAAGYPDDDAEALAAWASRVAHQAALGGVRRVVASGSPAAIAALDAAFDIAGIARVEGRPVPRRKG